MIRFGQHKPSVDHVSDKETCCCCMAVLRNSTASRTRIIVQQSKSVYKEHNNAFASCFTPASLQLLTI